MAKLRASVLGVVCGLANAVAAQDEAPSPRQTDDDVASCASVSVSALLQVYGYTHVVTLRNACDQLVVCEVWTDVDPLPRFVLRAEPGTSSSIVTHRGSTSPQVSASSSCHFE